MKSKIVIAELLLALIISYWIITTYFSGTQKFEDLALGTETVTYQALDNQDRLIHIQHLDGKEDKLFEEAWRQRGSKPVTLILGNSQTHSINQKKDGQVNYVELLSDLSADTERDILCVSFPNAGMQEFYLAYTYLRQRFPIKEMVIPVFMDDMREDGIRDVFFTEVINKRFLLPDSSNSVNASINKDLMSNWTAIQPEEKDLPNEDLAALSETVQERTETDLNNLLAENSAAWRNRPNVRGDFFVWLYMLRNTVFRINANTVRRMIPQKYEKNMVALNNLVHESVDQGTKILVYVPPIRSDVQIPYDQNEYKKFKHDIASIAEANKGSVQFRDFDSIVPGELWGYKAATNLTSEREIDFMHFQFMGHKILADSLSKELNLVKQ